MKTGVLEKVKNLLLPAKRLPVPEYPASVLLEPTNVCNLRCRMCPIYGEGVSRRRETGYIKRDIWEAAIAEIGSWPANVGLDVHGAGEPLLHPDFFDIVALAKSHHNISVGFFCNATLLDRDKARAVVEHGVDWICFSVDGGEKEVFEYYRKGAVLEAVEENIRYLCSIRRGKPHIVLNMVGHAEASVEIFVKRWAGMADLITVSLKRPARRDDNARLRLLKPCPFLYQQLVVGWSGLAGLCCEDFWGDYVIGEFPKESLHGLWHGRRMQEARRLHESSGQDKIHICRTCDMTIFHQHEETAVEAGGKSTTVRVETRSLNPDMARPGSSR